MKRVIPIFLFLLFSGFTALTQPFGNEWIDYSKKYLKVKVPQTGIYKINYSTIDNALQSIGENTSSINPQSFKLYNKGAEVPIYVEGEADGQIDTTDFIEFFGEYNSGWLDEKVYRSPQEWGNPYYSLFNDTAIYFLTWGGNTGNLRYQVYSDLDYSQSGLNAHNYIFREEIQVYSSTYFFGETDNFGKTDPEYTRGEGWFDAAMNYLQSRTKSIATPLAYTVSGAPDALLKTVIIGASNAVQNPDHRSGIFVGAAQLNVLDTTYDGFQLIKKQFLIPPSTLGATTSVKFESLALSTPPASDRTTFPYISIKYARQLNFSATTQFEFYVPASSSKSYLNVINSAAASRGYFYDITNSRRITISPSANTFQAIMPSAAESRCFIASEAATKIVTQLFPVETNGNFTDFLNQGVDSAFIILTHPNFIPTAQLYANYKNTQGLSSVVVDVEKLYDQFAYGIRKHPLSIRNFCNFAIHQWPSPPQYLFLVGKSISDYQCRKNVTNFNANLVPSFGFPTSDILLTAGLNNSLYEPALATGRLVVRTESEIDAYLEKLKEYEFQKMNPYTIEDRLWQKKVMHFAGGSNAAEQVLLGNYLSNYAQVLTDTSMGANITLFSKNSTAQIQVNVSDSIRTLINQGVAIMTFFGHAAGSGFDISIDDVNAYSNKGKYPLLVANSCYIGDLHQPVSQTLPTNEAFVLTPEKGVIGFLASVSLGYPNRLHEYTLSFYRNLSRDYYGKSIGKTMQKAIRDIQVNNPAIKATCFEMSLHGDPSVSIYNHEKPDFVIKPEFVSFSPEVISTEMDSFQIKAQILNIGRGVNRNFEVSVKRYFPDGSDTTYRQEKQGINYKSDLLFTLPVDPTRGVGLNTFDVSVDSPMQLVDEIDNVGNNTVNVSMRITSNDLVPIYPYKYGVIPSKEVRLKASTLDPFAPARDYIIQIDTTDFFNSPIKKERIVNSPAGLVEWNPELSYTPDSVVYYWRTSPYFADTSQLRWRLSSFQIIPEKVGWSQAHFLQHRESEKSFLNFNIGDRKFEYVPANTELRVTNVGNPALLSQYYDVEYRLNSVFQEGGICQGQFSLLIAIIDPITHKPWGTRWIDNSTSPPAVFNPQNYFGNFNDLSVCLNRVKGYFQFRINVLSDMDGMADMLMNHVPDSFHIMIYSGRTANFQDTTRWKNNHYQAMEHIGIDSIRYLPTNHPIIYYIKKGDLSTRQLVVGDAPNSKITLFATLFNSNDYGIIESPTIGPAKKWGSMHWRMFPQSLSVNDSVSFEVIGIKKNKEEMTLFTADPSKIDFLDLDKFISADVFPNLRFRLFFKDKVSQSAAQLKSWHVYYEGVPEFAVDPAKGVYFVKDTLQQGQELFFSLPIVNVSDFFTDSLNLSYKIRNSSGQISNIDQGLKKAFGPQEVLHDTLRLDTRNFMGRNTLLVEVNPKSNRKLYQPEQYDFNNFYNQAFYVTGDKTNPIMDVTFDGIHILDGDIVSPYTLIEIEVKDENRFLALDDTSYFKVYVTDPDGQKHYVPYVVNGTQVLRFIPGDLPENKAALEYKGDFKKDGKYTLKVEVQDASGNRAGNYDYSINFEVINRSTITHIMNYPNPFTTSTRFVFTLTGSKIPDFMRIQIITITGKVIREIDKNELGPIRIGRNITQYAWDGTDEYGDRLANGLYLYRVITKIQGEEIELRETGADYYFKKGFGKMYLMR
jgi:hypothetical protein